MFLSRNSRMLEVVLKHRKGPQNHDHDECMVSYHKFQGTRRMGCPAIIQIRGIKVFHGYQVNQSLCETDNSLKVAKKKVLDQLKDMSNDANSVSSVMRFYLKIPLCNEHKNHCLGAAATINHCVDRRVINKIYELVRKGVTHPMRSDGVSRNLLKENYLWTCHLVNNPRQRIISTTQPDKTYEIMLQERSRPRSRVRMTKNHFVRKSWSGKQRALEIFFTDRSQRVKRDLE